MQLSLFLAFLVAASILTITPGVDTAIVLRSAAAQGKRAGWLAACGVTLGCLAWGALVSLGLGAMLQASHLAYFIVKCFGAAYLIWFGAKLLLHPRDNLALSAGSNAKPFRNGLLTNLLNPKIGVFYVTFLPQFVPAGANLAFWTFMLALVHIGLSLIWFAALILATTPLARALKNPAILAWLDRAGGAIFIGFGLKLALSRA